MFLILPDEVQVNESLESFLIRLYQVNGYDSYRTLAFVVRDWLYDHDNEASGAWPLVLQQANIYHANHSSAFRVRAFKLLDSLFHDASELVLSKCLLNSASFFSPRLSSVAYRNVLIPQSFLRKSSVPICPKCLRESDAIPVFWHFKPYQVCHIHECELVSHCPKCNNPLNYIMDEKISHCRCGYDLTSAEGKEVDDYESCLSKYLAGEDLNDLPQCFDMSERLGIILWFYHRYKPVPKYDPKAIIEYFSQWPNIYYDELNAISELAVDRQLKSFNHTDFKAIFGDILICCRKLPYREPNKNMILKATINYLIQLVDKNPKNKVANLADVKLNVIEAAAILSTSIEQVYRLIEDGYLKLCIRLKRHSRLSPFQSAFYLRHVIELRQSQLPILGNQHTTYLPTW
ncbi:TniQ family protein [Photobacterium damselae]|uniref:TniQ family protein n=1 Tax=Photobacterium damselae TaxID=38293 RepID=UPI001EFD8834|nr:TniQ family protein [Photobacterium damselae]MCG9778804.1 TniQ family protein [Photobacterium damselae]